jgi:hypothetical protein
MAVNNRTVGQPVIRYSQHNLLTTNMRFCKIYPIVLMETALRCLFLDPSSAEWVFKCHAKPPTPLSNMYVRL